MSRKGISKGCLRSRNIIYFIDGLEKKFQYYRVETTINDAKSRSLKLSGPDRLWYIQYSFDVQFSFYCTLTIPYQWRKLCEVKSRAKLLAFLVLHSYWTIPNSLRQLDWYQFCFEENFLLKLTQWKDLRQFFYSEGFLSDLNIWWFPINEIRFITNFRNLYRYYITYNNQHPPDIRWNVPQSATNFMTPDFNMF